MRIPQEKIDDIRTANDIVEVIGASVKLKKRGKNYLGLCPFHTEKTPSFTVSAEKQMYHCFGCHRGGNVFTFVMELEKSSFVEAVRTLADRVGIVIPESRADDEAASELDALYAACRFSGLAFHDNLTKTDEGRSALDYFHRRGFTDETIRLFGLGYSLDSWDALLQKAHRDKISPDDLLKAGLLRRREDGSTYDYFRGRAMFPIFSSNGRVIGFGARKMRDDDPIQGKYINSPETPIYNKSRTLYGMSHAKESIRQEEAAILVEGYADLISLFQAGVQHVVSSSGTALTEEQLTLLGRYTRRLFMVFDADSAGSEATLRGVDLALEKDFDVRVVELPEGDDPDSFVSKNGGKAFRALLDQSVSFIDFKAGQFKKAGAFTTPEGKTEAVRSIVQSIAKMGDELKRSMYIKEVAEKYGIYESVLHREVDRWHGQDRRTRGPAEVRHTDRQTASSPSTAPTPPQGMIPAAERDILKLLVEGRQDIVQYLFAHIGLDHFSDGRARKVAQALLDILDHRGPMDAAALVNEVDDPEFKTIVTDVALSKYELSRGWEAMEKEFEPADSLEIAKRAVAVLLRQALQKEMDRNQQALKDASLRGEDAMPFVRRHQELTTALKSLEQQAS